MLRGQEREIDIECIVKENEREREREKESERERSMSNFIVGSFDVG